MDYNIKYMSTLLDFESTNKYLKDKAIETVVKYYQDIQNINQKTRLQLEDLPEPLIKIIRLLIQKEAYECNMGLYRYIYLSPKLYSKIVSIIKKDAKSATPLFVAKNTTVDELLDRTVAIIKPRFFSKFKGADYADLMLDIVGFSNKTILSKKVRAMSTKKQEHLNASAQKLMYQASHFYSRIWSLVYRMIAIMSFMNDIYKVQDYYVIGAYSVYFSRDMFIWFIKEILKLVDKKDYLLIKNVLYMWGPLEFVSEEILMLKAKTDPKAGEIYEQLKDMNVDFEDHVDAVYKAIKYLEQFTDPVIPLRGVLGD